MKLGAWLKENSMTQREFLQLATERHQGNFTFHALAKWCNGQRIPRPDDMNVIFEATNGSVSPNDFYLLQRNKQ